MSLELASTSPVVYNHYAHKSLEEDYLRRSVRRNAFSPSLSTAVQGLAELSPAELQVRVPCAGGGGGWGWGGGGVARPRS
jgi:hypothetical protein